MASRRIRTLTQVSLASFADNMKKLAQRAFRKSNEGMQDVAYLTVDSLITDTPKLTNQAAANWQAAINTSAEFKPGYTSLRGARRSARRVIAKRKPGDTIHISNLTPYISLLNQGSSQQAPAMFVEAAMSRAREKARKIKLLEE